MANERQWAKGGGRWLGPGAFCLLSACGTTQVNRDYDRQLNFAQFRTFDVQTGQVVRNGVPDVGDTLVRDRLDRAVTVELAEKGLRATEEDPDLIVTYRADITLVAAPRAAWHLGLGVGLGLGWGPVGIGVGPSVGVTPPPRITENQQGTIAVDLIDANTRRLVYRAVTRAENKDFRSPEFIQKAVDEALDDYPARKRG